MNSLFLTSAPQPQAIIESLGRRPEQPASHRQFREGFESYFGLLPVLEASDPLLALKVKISGTVMKALAADLTVNAPWVFDTPAAGEFARSILAIEEPRFLSPTSEEFATLFTGNPQSFGRFKEAFQSLQRQHLREGAEVIVAQWGPGFKSPVHGHGAGLLHEEILHGKILVNQYRWIKEGVVRPLRSDPAEAGTLISQFSPPDPRGPRMGIIHNFIAVTGAASLHYVPEHTRDGRDNGFKVEEFHLTPADVIHITSADGLNLRPGDVALVRSANVAEYGDHFIVITGAPEIKAHGLRPKDVAIHTTVNSQLLDDHNPHRGLVLLKLVPEAARKFREFHAINLKGNKVTFPEV